MPVIYHSLIQNKWDFYTSLLQDTRGGGETRCSVEWERERFSKGVRQRRSKAGGMPEDYQADLQQICPTRQMDQRLDQDQWSAYIYPVE